MTMKKKMKWNESYQIEKEVKLLPFADDMSLCTNNKNTVRTNKQAQQGCTVQDQYTKINYISIY